MTDVRAVTEDVAQAEWAELDAAQEQQLADLAQLEAAGQTVAGWKLGLTSGASRNAFGAGFRPFGYVLASRLLRSGSTLWWDDSIGKGAMTDSMAGSIENEVCFELAETISEPETAESVREALKGYAPAFEINQVRLAQDASAAARVADNLSHWGLVVGETMPLPADWSQAVQARLKVSLLHNADGVESVLAQDHIDDHFVSLARLSNRLLRFGRQLEKGQKVITGAFGRAREPQRGLWSGDFGELGRVHVRIER